MSQTVPEVLAAIESALPFVPAEELGEPREALEAARVLLIHIRDLMQQRRDIGDAIDAIRQTRVVEIRA